MFTPLLDTLIFFVLTTPLMGLVGGRIKHEKRIVEVYVISALIFSLVLIPLFYSEVLKEGSTLVVGWGSPQPEGAFLEIDTLSIFMAVIYLTIGLMASIFSTREFEREDTTGYYTILLGMIAAMIGIVFSGDLFTLFIFWEAMCICSYALVAFKRERWESIEASYKYLIMSSAGSITMLFAFSFLYGLTGTLNISYLSVGLARTEGNPIMLVVLIMLLIGFGLQAGMFPFHTWLPDAHMAAPSSVSAVLSGVMVKVGAYGLIKVLLTIFAPMYESWRVTLAVFAVSTMFVGNLSALLQDDVKRLLAFSTIANTGYILLGIATGSQRALTGSLFHVMNHAVVKALLFLCAGAFIHKTGTRSLKELAGIRRSMPITGTLFIIGTLSLASIPALNLFWSEISIITAGLEAGMPIFSLLMVVNLVFSAVYCLRMIQTLAVKKETPTSKKAEEASLPMLIPILALGLLSILIGVYPSPFQTFAEEAAKAALKQ